MPSERRQPFRKTENAQKRKEAVTRVRLAAASTQTEQGGKGGLWFRYLALDQAMRLHTGTLPACRRERGKRGQPREDEAMSMFDSTVEDKQKKGKKRTKQV
jgi:hypothetical protein